METKYTIIEKRGTTRVGQRYSLSSASLTLVKRTASRTRLFRGTTLVIVDEDKGLQVASKEPGCRWHTEEWA